MPRHHVNPATSPGGTDTASKRKIAFLLSLTPDTELRETHMSWVFLQRDRVLKMKKPVRYAFLDFSTLSARRAFCHEEVRLNRRLAADVYLGARALTRKPDGGLALAPAGTEYPEDEVVEWLVEMRRLPESRMLDAAIAADTVSKRQVEAVGHLLADFYAGAVHPLISPETYLERQRQQIGLNRAILTSRNFMLDHGRDIRALDAVEARLDEHAEEIRSRVAAGWIVEGHGDLRPEHVCIAEPPVIIDCLEFNEALRMVDPYEEIAVLDMECRRLGADWIGPILIDQVEARLGHRPSQGVIDYHIAHRALIRARLALAHLLEPSPRTPEKWEPLARSYLDVAEATLSIGEAKGAR